MRHIIHAVILAAFMSVGIAHAGGYNEKLAGWLDKAKNDPKFAAHVLRMGTDGYPLAVVYAAGGNALVEADLLKPNFNSGFRKYSITQGVTPALPGVPTTFW